MSVCALLGASYGQQRRQIRDEKNSVEQLPWIVMASCIKCRAGRTRVRKMQGLSVSPRKRLLRKYTHYKFNESHASSNSDHEE